MRPTLAATAILLLAAARAAHAQTPAPPAPREPAMDQTVSVTGVGKVTLTPDRVTFSAGVQTTAPSLGAATSENGQRMAAVIAALKAAGATDKELRTSGLNIYPQQAQLENRPPKIVGYQVSNMVTVTGRDPAAASKLVEAAVNSGANTVSGIQFTVSDPARGRDQGLQAAFADARSKAETLAKAAGRTIGRALAITEGGATMPPVPRPMYRMAEQAMLSSVPVEAGAEELAFTISVVFELQ